LSRRSGWKVPRQLREAMLAPAPPKPPPPLPAAEPESNLVSVSRQSLFFLAGGPPLDGQSSGWSPGSVVKVDALRSCLHLRARAAFSCRMSLSRRTSFGRIVVSRRAPSLQNLAGLLNTMLGPGLPPPASAALMSSGTQFFASLAPDCHP